MVQAGHTLYVLVDVGVAGGRAGAGGGGGVAAVGILLVSIVSILWAGDYGADIHGMGLRINGGKGR